MDHHRTFGLVTVDVPPDELQVPWWAFFNPVIRWILNLSTEDADAFFFFFLLFILFFVESTTHATRFGEQNQIPQKLNSKEK